MNKLKTIVLAEDNATFSLLLKFRLEKENYNLIIVEDGKDAIEKIKEHNPNLILTDINMPHVTGLELTSYVRVTLGLNTPIIVFSAGGHEEMVKETIDVGANKYIEKPFSPNDLVVLVKEFLD